MYKQIRGQGRNVDLDELYSEIFFSFLFDTLSTFYFRRWTIIYRFSRINDLSYSGIPISFFIFVNYF